MQRLFLLAVALIVLGSVSGADTIHLKNGGRFEGKVVKDDGDEVVFKIRGVGPQTFKKADILRIEEGATVFDEYEDRLAAVPDGDAGAWFELANWCMENGLRLEGRRAFGRTVRADPDHPGARRSLGYTNVAGKWLDRRQLQSLRERQQKELEKVVGGLCLGAVAKDPGSNVQFRPPDGWKRRELSGGLMVEFVGPELHGITLAIGYETASPLDAADYRKSVLAEVRAAAGEIRLVKEDATASLGGKMAVESICRFGEGESEAERHDVYLTRESDLLHVWYVCPVNDRDALRGLFIKVLGTFEESQAKLGTQPFAYKLPDDDWARGMDEFDGPVLALGDDVDVIHHQTNMALIFMCAQKVAGAAAVDQFRHALLSAIGGSMDEFTAIGDKEERRKVAGISTTVTPFRARSQGDYMEGSLCVFGKGSRMYVILLVSDGLMDERALKKDFGKLLDSFRIP